MPSILVVEQEERYVERINGALSAEGWRVRIVPRADQAIQAAASEAPDLVLVSAEIPGAETLASSFSRSAGGPGVVGMLSETGTGAMEADDLLAKPFTDEQLRSAARRALGSRRITPPVAASKAEHKLTSQDIFGDVLAEVESDLARSAAAPAAAARPAPSPKASPAAADDEMQRRLEQTLSGVMRPELKPRPAAPPPPPRRPEPAADNVDALLSKTLSDLDLGRTKTGVRAPAPRPPAAKPAPAAAAAPIPPSAPATAAPPAAAAAVPPSAPQPVPAKEATAVRRRVGDIDFSELEELARVSKPAPRPAPPSAVQAPARPQPAPAAKAVPPAAAPTPAAVPADFDAAATQRIPLFLEETGDQPGERFGQYTLLERVAVGGMAELWKARMRGVEGFQKTVAIKRILPHMTDNAEFVGMFIDEAKLAAQLTHPNIVHIYDLGKIGRDYYIAMEFVDGKDLRSLLNAGSRKGMPLPLELGLLIAARVASALDYAHRKRDFEDRELGLVHRDVSPQNVLLTYEGDVKLCDFGIAKAAAKASQTQMGALKGKLQYMSPEQAWGRHVDARSDLFSLGAVLFEMVTGERLFPGDSEMSVLESVRQGKTRSPRQVNPAIPREVDEIVARAIAIDPQERFQSADEMKRRLGMAISALAPSVGPTDLAAYLHRVLETAPVEPVAEPSAGEAPAPVSASWVEEPAAMPAVAAAAAEEQPVEAVAPLLPVKVEDEGGRRSRTLLYAAIAALLVVGVVAFFLLNRRPAAPSAEASTGAPAAVQPAANPAPAPAVPVGPSAAQPAGTGAQMPADVKAIVDKQLAEEQKKAERRHEEELKALEKQVAEAEKAKPAPAPAAQTPPAQVPAAEPPPPAAAAAEQPAQREPEPVQAQAPPSEPPAPAPEAPRAKLGDLVTPGLGVTLPKLVSSPKPEYPPMARKLGVQGVVTVSVLVDENGQIEDVRMLEPIPQKVGINEAAMSAARAVRYQPATKDGVRVKMWTRLRIPFKQ